MNGLLAALLAHEGFTGPTAMLDGRRDLPATLLGVTDLGRAAEDLSQRWEILRNSTKLSPPATSRTPPSTPPAPFALEKRPPPRPWSRSTVA
jgi:hypothetical protein